MGKFKLLDSYFGMIKKFLPSEESGHSVGVDIAAAECKLVEITRDDNGDFRLLNFVILPIQNNDVASALKECLKRLKAPAKNIYSAVFGKGTLIRYIDMPRMNLDELKNSFSIEADKYFPFAQDQIYTDCYILDAQSKNKDMSVMAAAAKKEIIDNRLKLLNELNIKADFVGINPIALVNVIHTLGVSETSETPKEANKNKETAIGLLDMGESVSNLTILVDRLPRFTRDIFVGGRDLTNKISNALGVSFEEAEKLKGNISGQEEAILRACESSINAIVSELRLSFDYFSSEKNCEISELYLTGGASLMKGVAETIGKHLEIPVRSWDPFSKVKVDENLDETDVRKKSMKLGVALGLALYEYD